LDLPNSLLNLRNSSSVENTIKIREYTKLPDVQLPPGHTWQYDRAVDEGDEGIAYLWAHVDAEQRVVECIVIKNTYRVVPEVHFVEEGPDAGKWLEVYVQQKLHPSGSTDACTVPVLAAQKIPGTKHSWRTYMPYYSRGDLGQLIETHDQHPIPKPFLWFLLHRMVRAAVAMDEVFREEGKDGPVLVHQDIKPANIFLAHPGSLGRDADYIYYPVPFLGDFGSCYLTRDDESWKGKPAGTLGYHPPEQDRGFPPRPRARHDVPPGSRTNIWEIGFCVLLLMTRNEGGLNAEGGLVYTRIPEFDELVESGEWNDYSDDLLEVVERCLMDRMQARPSPQNVLARIEQVMPDHAEGMDRWGTVTWVRDKSRDIDGPIAADAEETKDTGVGSSSTMREKRKVPGSPESRPDAKRIKAQTALERRLAYVAFIMSGDLQIREPHEDDQAFRLDHLKRLQCGDVDETFDPDTFFGTADAGPISFFELAGVAGDGPAKKAKAKEASAPLENDSDGDEKEGPKSTLKPSRPTNEDVPASADGDDDDDDEEYFTKPTGASKLESKGGKEKVAAVDEEYGDDDHEEGLDFGEGVYAGGGGTFDGDDDEEE
ncbi:kinase-like protein, partial [Aureobasidium melanogenum]